MQGRLKKIFKGFKVKDNKSFSDSQEKLFGESQKRAEELNEVYRDKNHRHAPLPLQRTPMPPQPFPFAALGTIPGAAAKRIHDVVQAPDSTCGQSVLGVLSLASQGFIDVEIDGRVYPCSLYLITISESGERKSGADKVASKPIYEWQRMLVQQHSQQLIVFKNNHDLWKKKRETALKEASDPSKKVVSLDIEDEPKPPCEGLIICDEPTLEGLEQLLARGQPSAGIFSDEGGRLVGGHAMSADNALKTACGLSNLWDGKPFTRVRKSEGSKIYYGRRLAMHLMIQPIVLTEIVNNPILMGQGVLARCLFAEPLPIAGTRKYVEVDLSTDQDIIAFYALINSIIDRPYPVHNNQKSKNAGIFNLEDGLTPQVITLTLDAKRCWIEFHNQIDVKMGKGQTYNSIKPFASKAAEQVLRIAGIFAFAEQLSIEKPQIMLEHIERAITIVEFYLNEALRIVGCSSSDPDIALAIQTLEWLRKERVGVTFPLSEVYQYGPTAIRSANKAKSIMQILKNHEYVEESSNVEIHGCRVRSAWRLV